MSIRLPLASESRPGELTQPEDYFVVRDAIVRAIRTTSASWSDELDADWRQAITAIAVPMLQGAAVHTAVVAEQLADGV
jgi:hypothetical protein